MSISHTYPRHREQLEYFSLRRIRPTSVTSLQCYRFFRFIYIALIEKPVNLQVGYLSFVPARRSESEAFTSLVFYYVWHATSTRIH